MLAARPLLREWLRGSRAATAGDRCRNILLSVSDRGKERTPDVGEKVVRRGGDRERRAE